ncbi:uncharacterized protein LOC107273264 isoform X2 [Cephus cinctus]|uniref:Uncharacterized protein LOC107273264 isoform X2 n=1 Tax=Cephus cinctus TaxID=211228 RepID=A0AAJ7FSZ4_CEPCN|nr:uncharacterized protein LOC107273264 isoform X2 [Cephus cinctus]
MRSIFVTGSNRGLGLGLIKHLVQSSKPPEYIFATCRNPDKALELKEIAQKSGGVHIIKLDLTDIDSYKNVVKVVEEKLAGRGLNVLVNNAGISSKFARLNYVKEKQLTEAFMTNSVAPILLAKELLPLLKKAASNATDKKSMSVERAAIINMTSILGSITENDQGGFYPYRCSKAALNAATKSMSIDLKDDGILVVCLHPGWVRTDLGGKNAPIDVDTSIQGILSTLDTLTEAQTGCFLHSFFLDLVFRYLKAIRSCANSKNYIYIYISIFVRM